MRSLKIDSNYRSKSLILGVVVRYGKWYKIYLNGVGDIFWLARFYGIEKDRFGNSCFLHLKTSYCIKPGHYIRDYNSRNGGYRSYHPLCDIREINSILMVSVDYVNSILTF